MRAMIRVAGVALGFLALSAILIPAIGDAQGQPTNTFTVTKIVEGEAPAGTEFVVEVTCDDIPQNPEFPVELTFGPTGGSQFVEIFTQTESCTATETNDGGAASVAYGGTDTNDCAITATATDVTADYAQPNEASAEAPPESVDCAVTVTNTFASDPGTGPDDGAQPADVVGASPSFTG